MLDDDDAMRAVFFDTDDFAEVVTITIAGGQPFDVTGILDTRPVINPVALSKAQVGFKDGMLNTGNSPQFQCITNDVANVKPGRATLYRPATPKRAAETYNVWDAKPDGTGFTLLILKVAS